MIRKQVGDLSTHTTKYTSPALTQKVFANIRRVGKGFSGVETLLFEEMLVAQEVEEGDADVNVEDVNTSDAAEDVKSQAEIYKIDLDHANKVLSMQEEESKPAKFTTITAADVPILAAITATAPTLTAAPSRRKKGVVIRDPEESNTTKSTIIHSKAKFKDKGKGILVKEPKPLKKQAQIEQDEKYARELEAALNRTIDWDEVIDHVNKKAKQDPAVKWY
nr:hypothetical protein [Tanacetum cinerariifolium]